MRPPRVLHILPHDLQQHWYAGSTKDVLGRSEYFSARGMLVDELVAPGRSDTALLKHLRVCDLRAYHAVFFEFTLYPQSLRFLRARYPQLTLVARAFHAEFMHHLHYAAAHFRHTRGWRGTLAGIMSLRQALRRLRYDYVCAQQAHYILTITQWERERYWSHLKGSSDAKCVPYYLPQAYATSFGIGPKKPQCVCLTSPTRGTLPFTVDAVKNLARLVEQLNGDDREWSFPLTGDLPAGAVVLPTRIRRTGFLDTPFGILAESRAMALLSDYGLGFKTKILDAICCGCYVLVTTGLYRRLPPEVQPFCIPVDARSVDSFRSALAACSRPYPERNPNELLREQAFAALDEVFAP